MIEILLMFNLTAKEKERDWEKLVCTEMPKSIIFSRI